PAAPGGKQPGDGEFILAGQGGRGETVATAEGSGVFRPVRDPRAGLSGGGVVGDDPRRAGPRALAAGGAGGRGESRIGAAALSGFPKGGLRGGGGLRRRSGRGPARGVRIPV